MINSITKDNDNKNESEKSVSKISEQKSFSFLRDIRNFDRFVFAKAAHKNYFDQSQ